MAPRPSRLTDVEKGLLLRSRFAQSLDIPTNVCLGLSVAAALPNALFDQPVEEELQVQRKALKRLLT